MYPWLRSLRSYLSAMFLSAVSLRTLPFSLITKQAARPRREGADSEMNSQVAHVSSHLSYKSVYKCLSSEAHGCENAPDRSWKDRKSRSPKPRIGPIAISRNPLRALCCLMVTMVTQGTVLGGHLGSGPLLPPSIHTPLLSPCVPEPLALRLLCTQSPGHTVLQLLLTLEDLTPTSSPARSLRGRFDAGTSHLILSLTGM